jgi:CHAT domain-containing protein
MLAMIKDEETDILAHPRFWAPFVVVGEPTKPKN